MSDKLSKGCFYYYYYYLSKEFLLTPVTIKPFAIPTLVFVRDNEFYTRRELFHSNYSAR